MLDGLKNDVIEVFGDLQEKSAKSLHEWRDRLLAQIKSALEANQQRFEDADLSKLVKRLAKVKVETNNVQYKKLTHLPAELELNVGGEIFCTKLATLKRIPGSILDDVVSGRAQTAVDDDGRIMIRTEPEVFKAALKYVESDRTWLPSAKKGSKVHRDLVETEIRKWRLDKGLANPAVLLTRIAKEYQERVLNQEPSLYPGSDNRAL